MKRDCAIDAAELRPSVCLIDQQTGRYDCRQRGLSLRRHVGMSVRTRCSCEQSDLQRSSVVTAKGSCFFLIPAAGRPSADRWLGAVTQTWAHDLPGTFRPGTRLFSLKREELAMFKKIVRPPKTVVPKEQPVYRPDDTEAPRAPDDHEHPTRDTRETPAPNPNGEHRDQRDRGARTEPVT